MPASTHGGVFSTVLPILVQVCICLACPFGRHVQLVYMYIEAFARSNSLRLKEDFGGGLVGRTGCSLEKAQYNDIAGLLLAINKLTCTTPNSLRHLYLLYKGHVACGGQMALVESSWQWSITSWNVTNLCNEVVIEEDIGWSGQHGVG